MYEGNLCLSLWCGTVELLFCFGFQRIWQTHVCTIWFACLNQTNRGQLYIWNFILWRRRRMWGWSIFFTFFLEYLIPTCSKCHPNAHLASFIPICYEWTWFSKHWSILWLKVGSRNLFLISVQHFSPNICWKPSSALHKMFSSSKSAGNLSYMSKHQPHKKIVGDEANERGDGDCVYKTTAWGHCLSNVLYMKEILMS